MPPMVNVWSKFLLVALLACLQCVAPLIHAHTNGLQDHHDTYITVQETDDAAYAHAFEADHDHGQAIGVAKEFKRDYILPFFDVARFSVYAPPPQIVLLAPDLWRSVTVPFPRFTRPPARAP